MGQNLSHTRRINQFFSLEHYVVRCMRSPEGTLIGIETKLWFAIVFALAMMLGMLIAARFY